MAFGGTSSEEEEVLRRSRPPAKKKKESLSEGGVSGAGARAGGGGEEEDKEDDSKHPDVAWTAVVTMLRHVDDVRERLKGRCGEYRERVSMERRTVVSNGARGFVGSRLGGERRTFYCADTLAGEEKERAAMDCAGSIGKLKEEMEKGEDKERREGERCERDRF